MKKLAVVIGAASLGLASSASLAEIQLDISMVNINTTLAANGWIGYDVSLSTTGASTGISAIDFKNYGGGIRGPLHQSWIIDELQNVPTTTRSSLPFNLTSRRDSFFYIGAGTGNPGGFVNGVYEANEDNNFLNGPNPPYDRSPLADLAGDTTVPGYNNGVGSFMTMQGTYSTPLSNRVHLAFIIVSQYSIPVFAYGYSGLLIDGVVWDQNGTPFTVHFPVPEPWSITVLAAGAAPLLLRKRRP